MCCTGNRKTTRDFVNWAEKQFPNRIVTGWKLLNTKAQSIHCKYQYGTGEHKIDPPVKDIYEYLSLDDIKGFHVWSCPKRLPACFSTIPTKNSFQTQLTLHCVKVFARIDDLIIAGESGEPTTGEPTTKSWTREFFWPKGTWEAVFNAITITEKQWKMALLPHEFILNPQPKCMANSSPMLKT